MIEKSYAKINLSLKVTGIREDGYHELEMVNLPLDLHDVIVFDHDSSYQDTYVICDDPGLSSLSDNLATKAFNLMREKYGFKQNFIINIHKRIPFAAGLGGGSSNAACVISFINKYCKLNRPLSELKELGATLGADVPYFLDPHPSLVSGIGEKIESIPCKKTYYCLLVKPEKGCSTKEVYKISDKSERVFVDTENVIKGLATGDDALIAKSIGNDLMPTSVSMVPEIGEIYASLTKDGFSICRMSGSGSTVFALSSDLRKCRLAQRKYEDMGYIVRLCQSMK